MAKGDDAVRKKKNKVMRKRMRDSESSVSARVAAIIASKRRRKAGKRRISEGMCFSLPTPEDPFNDRYDKKNLKEDKKKDKPKIKKSPSQKPHPNSAMENQEKEAVAVAAGGKPAGYENSEDGSSLSKFLIVCLNTIQKSWRQEGGEGDDDENDGEGNEICASSNLLAGSFGAKLWKHCSSGSNVVDTRSGGCANKEQIAWMLSISSYIVTTREKEGHILNNPFLLYLVSSQERAAEVRSVSKPLKALGVHTVSLHSGASIEHQIHGLKSCEPEFIVSTPERLLELVHLQAIDLSGVSLLVLDDLKSLVHSGLYDKVISIKEKISGEPQVVVFNDYFEETSKLHEDLLKGPVSILSLDDTVSTEGEGLSERSQ